MPCRTACLAISPHLHALANHSVCCVVLWLKVSACDAGIPLTENMFTPLSEAMEVWHFDMLSPPEESDRKTLDVTFTQ